MKKAAGLPSLRKIIRDRLFQRAIKVPRWLLTEEQKFLRDASSKLTRQDTVIDLGAHIGRASVEFSHRAGKVYAFEPNPHVFAELKRNVARYRNIVPLNKAASDTTGAAELFFEENPKPGRFSEAASLAEGKSNLNYSNSQTVETVNIADFIRDLDVPVRMIKMDVEGYEYKLITILLDGGVMNKIGTVHVEDHCDRIPSLSEERDKVLARIDAEGLTSKFDFEWP